MNKNDERITLTITPEMKSIYDIAYTLVDLNAIVSGFHYIIDSRSGKRRPLPGELRLTSRSFTKTTQDSMRLVKIEQGSLVLTIFVSIATKCILHFIKKIFEKHTPHNVFIINNNKGTININLSNSTEENICQFIENLKKEGAVPKDIDVSEKDRDVIQLAKKINSFSKDLSNK